MDMNNENPEPVPTDTGKVFGPTRKDWEREKMRRNWKVFSTFIAMVSKILSIFFFGGAILMIGTIGYGIYQINADYAGSRTLTPPYELSQEPIASLETASQIYGSFLLGTGSIEGRTYYYFYIRNVDNSYSLHKVPTDSSKIYMDAENASAHLTTVVVRGGSITCKKGVSDSQCLRETMAWDYQKEYQFHVPKGTIIERYNAMVNQ